MNTRSGFLGLSPGMRINKWIMLPSGSVIAGRDMALSGKEVSITTATDQHVQTHTVEQKTSGLTLALSGTVGSALNDLTQQ